MHDPAAQPGRLVLTRRAAIGGLVAAAVVPAVPVAARPPTAAAGTLVPQSPVARERHSTTALFDGRVLVAGGYNYGPLATAQLFDPTANRWYGAGSMRTARLMHAAALLPDGRVLVAGGQNGDALASAEIYDPLTNTWSPGPPMLTARYGHSAAATSGGVLVTGGFRGGPLASVELFNGAAWVAL